jgi:transposase
MTSTVKTAPLRPVVAGVDTHSLTHHVAVLDAVTGQVLGDRQVRATTAGYRQAETFAAALGQVVRWGVEGTNSYGAGLARHLRVGEHEVLEVIRPDRSARRLKGKSDPLDATAAARQVLTSGDHPTPKASDGPVESIRVLAMTRASAVKARASVLRQIAMILVCAPAALRESLQDLGEKALLNRLRAARPGIDPTAGTQTATMIALRSLARRHQDLSTEIDQTTAMLRALIEQVAPALLATKGVGVVTAAQLLITVGDNPERIRNKAAFAALCGVSPIPASSGKSTRMRLNRGGDRQANCAIHQIALVRMSSDPRTKAYIAKKKNEGKTTREAMRCLKRHLANELFTTITNPPAIPDTTDLRPARQARGLTLTAVANHFGVWPAHISTIERGTRRDDDLAQRYRDWLTAA